MAKPNKQAVAQQPERKGPKICRPNEVDFNKMVLTKLNTDGTQSVSYINYADSGDAKDATSLLVQSGKIQLTHHGIPQLDAKDAKQKFYSDDSQREFIKIPLVPGVPEADELRKNLAKADAWFGSDAVRKQLFGKNEKNYEYTPCIRTPAEKVDDDDDDSKSKKSAKKDAPKIDYCKMKFSFSGQVPDKVNKTRLTRVIGTTKTPVVAKTVTDIANEIRYMSTVKFIFHYFKVWANKTVAQGAKKKVYGVGFKMISIEYTPGPNNRINPDSIDFISDDDGEEKKTTKSSSSKKAPKLDDSDDEKSTTKAKQTKKANSDSEESDKMPTKSNNSDSDEESDSPKTAKKTAKGKPTPKPAESDSDESSEAKPAKKAVKGKATAKPAESDSDESSEPKPSKKTAKGKPKPKPVDSDEDSDSPPKPVKKGAKGKAKLDSDNESASEEVPIQSKAKPKGKAASRGK